MSRMLELSQSKERTVRGKYAEDKVRDELKSESEKCASFDYERNYDAKSSMGRIPQRAGDYTYFAPQSHGVIEVKQLAHDFRLPRKNFNPDKFGILRKRRMAGGELVVLVFHSTTKLWRLVPFEFFDNLRDVPSWELSSFPTFKTCREALVEAGVLQA